MIRKFFTVFFSSFQFLKEAALKQAELGCDELRREKKNICTLQAAELQQIIGTTVITARLFIRSSFFLCTPGKHLYDQAREPRRWRRLFSVAICESDQHCIQQPIENSREVNKVTRGTHTVFGAVSPLYVDQVQLF